MLVEAGTLNKLGDLQRRSLTADGSGSQVETWATYATVWLSLTPSAGGESIASNQKAGTVTAEFSMRWRSDVRPDDRIVSGGQVWSIAAVFDPEERRRELRGTLMRVTT